MKRKRTRAHKLHLENVRAAWSYLMDKNPNLKIFGRPGWWYVQEHENSQQVEWASVGVGMTRAEAVIDAARILGWKLRRGKR